MRVCIAGVNQGLGLVLSRMMAKEGHTVYACFRNDPSGDVRKAARQFPGFKMVELDVTSEAMAERAAQKILEDGGKLDAVVVAAGILTDSDRELPVTEVAINDLRAGLETNTIGSAIMIKYFNKLINNGGMFITVTSEAGSMKNIGTKYPGYSISKAAQNKLVAIFAKNITDYKIYAVHPGRMNTVMGRNDAQIEPEESARGIFGIITGEKTVPPENGWFINYLGEAMEI
jgi:NAD(P)-dependent dehydrogenase (short-subunit alcohol dehydrogenase family)